MTVETAREQDLATHVRLTAAAPAPLIEKMRAAKLSGERKPVTALFADVVGSTAMAEQMDAEDWTVMMNAAFDRMSSAIFRYEGTIAQLQGDAMVAFFGAPIAHEDDPERAVFAALDMLDTAAQFAEELRRTQGLDFQIRAGINTGPVVVGNVGSDLRYEYTALGDAMNTAARMQSAAQPGTVLMTENTYRLAREAFDVEDLGEIEVKGKAEPVHAYRVLGRRTLPGRKRGLASVGLESPMVGRDGPLDALANLLPVVRAGRGRVAFLLAEPGIGKSRLLAELRRRFEAEAVRDDRPAPRWIEARCVSYCRNLPYHLLIDLVRSTLGIGPNATEAEARAILDRELAALIGDESDDVTPYFAHLLALPLRADEMVLRQTDPGVMQGRFTAALLRLLRGLTADGPCVLVCEDLHWADPASIEVARQVLPLAAELPVLFIGAMRPEADAPGWMLVTQSREIFGDALTEIRLEPLTDDQSRELVSYLLAIESLPESVRSLILARAEGNPFFVEEVVRMLIERGMIELRADRWTATDAISTIEIPDTLHGLLLARIDQLPDAAKRSLRVAAVIGRQFPVRVLEHVLGSGVQ